MSDYLDELERLIRLREAGSLNEAEFAQERLSLLDRHRGVVPGEADDSEHRSVATVPDRRSRALMGIGPFFFLTYVILMIPTYVLPYVGSNSATANTAFALLGEGVLPQFWLHLLCLFLLVIISWIRGGLIARPWLPVFPLLATLFDLVPVLNWIPLIPTVMHLLAITVGMSGAVQPNRFASGKGIVGAIGTIAILIMMGSGGLGKREAAFETANSITPDRSNLPNDATEGGVDVETPIAPSEDRVSDNINNASDVVEGSGGGDLANLSTDDAMGGSRFDDDEQRLINRWSMLNSDCRGGSGDDPATDQACTDRNEVSLKLNRSGLCYGRESEFGYQYQWHRCQPASYRSD